MRVTYVIKQMDATGLEPVTFGLQSRYSPTELSARELPVSPGCLATQLRSGARLLGSAESKTSTTESTSSSSMAVHWPVRVRSK